MAEACPDADPAGQGPQFLGLLSTSLWPLRTPTSLSCSSRGPFGFVPLVGTVSSRCPQFISSAQVCRLTCVECSHDKGHGGSGGSVLVWLAESWLRCGCGFACCCCCCWALGGGWARREDMGACIGVVVPGFSLPSPCHVGMWGREPADARVLALPVHCTISRAGNSVK